MHGEHMRRERLDQIVSFLRERGTPEHLRIAAEVFELYRSRDSALYWLLSVVGFNAPAAHTLNDFKRKAIAEWIAQDGAPEAAHDRARAWAAGLPGPTPPDNPL